MNLVIDYGNSAAKVGLFEGYELKKRLVLPTDSELQMFLKNADYENVMISSVKGNSDLLSAWAMHAKKKFILKHSLPLPINNLYATPATLGVDRLAGVCGAQQIFPMKHCLVIDAGTCITYDFVDKEKNYFGGGISPGLTMRFKAVHTFTAKLPLVSATENIPLIGNSTESSIQSGVVNGALAEIEGIINQYEKKFPGLKVILCGGDTQFFENQMKASIFASPELVLIGLNSILNYNVNH